jgi:hypothetical protein
MVNLNIKDCNCTYDTSQEAAGKVVEAIIN